MIEKLFWSIQKKVYTVCITIVAIGGGLTLLNVYTRSFIDQRAEDKAVVIASRLDSANHIPILQRIATTDAVLQRIVENQAAIRIDLEVIMTNDQRVESWNRRNATGIK